MAWIEAGHGRRRGRWTSSVKSRVKREVAEWVIAGSISNLTLAPPVQFQLELIDIGFDFNQSIVAATLITSATACMHMDEPDVRTDKNSPCNSSLRR